MSAPTPLPLSEMPPIENYELLVSLAELESMITSSFRSCRSYEYMMEIVADLAAHKKACVDVVQGCVVYRLDEVGWGWDWGCLDLLLRSCETYTQE